MSHPDSQKKKQGCDSIMKIKRKPVMAAQTYSDQSLYVEENNGYTTLVARDGDSWFYYDGADFLGINLYGDIDEIARKISDALKSGEWDFMSVSDVVNDAAASSNWSWIKEYQGYSLDDIDHEVNYNSDGTAKGHDETSWCEIEASTKTSRRKSVMASRGYNDDTVYVIFRKVRVEGQWVPVAFWYSSGQTLNYGRLYAIMPEFGGYTCEEADMSFYNGSKKLTPADPGYDDLKAYTYDWLSDHGDGQGGFKKIVERQRVDYNGLRTSWYRDTIPDDDSVEYSVHSSTDIEAADSYNQYEDLAIEFGEAIQKLASDEDHLNNFISYLTQHFPEWLQKFANTPEGLVSEFREFANMNF